MTDGSRDDLAARRGMSRKVYEPAEDSGLLASAIEKRGHGRLLEVGTGSGWVAERAAATDGVTEVVASDRSPHACRAAQDRTGADGGPAFAVVRADLVAAFTHDAFDTVAFNPPYLPTDPENEWDDWMERALSGGESGRELIEPFLESVPRVLRPDGIVLLLVSSLAGYDAVLDYATDRGFDIDDGAVVEESYPFETLSVVALRPSNAP
ncbi:HemK2/MTQ2 family protein methyltransferase [Halobellus ruber]|uniref:Methyltransferase n=1 Tax=Halobellus ruber TaxID=2761102 RepID=A0A7J9SF99_9EURY|nr:methyltransferase [Halobellus ruber]